MGTETRDELIGNYKWAFLRDIWKPFVAMVGVVVCTMFFELQSEQKLGFVPGIACICLFAINNKFVLRSRGLGYLVLGSFGCCAVFFGVYEYGDQFVRPYGYFGLCVGFVVLGFANSILIWSRSNQKNRFGFFAAYDISILSALGIILLVLFICFALPSLLPQQRDDLIWLGFLFSIAQFILAVVFFYRQAIELFLEPFLWLLYSVRGVGPCAYQLPPAGTMLIVANHASWIDPFVLAKVLPRPVTPMMTAKFYNIRLLRPLLKYVFKVIVVPEARVRREAPELQLAIAALDRGEVVVIFPEGALRRKEEVPLKRFGQGVHMILRERPETPVVSCWIEGAWGSFFSYFNGPPMKNKKMDFRRRIRIATSEPETVPEEVLAEQLPTRIYLMNRVLASRELLGLPPLPKFELPTRAEDDSAEI